MPLDSRHPHYLKFLPQWSRCRDAMSGADSIKGSTAFLPRAYDPDTVEMQALHSWRTDTHTSVGRAYLPQPSGMSAMDYLAYKTRACWFGASARVRQGLVGLVFREEPEVLAPAPVMEHAKDITRTGVSLDAFAYHMVTEDLTTGRFGILLDLPEEGQPADRVQPQWTLYPAEHVINWHLSRSPDGETVFDWLILEEEVDRLDPEDPYHHLLIRQWRELVLIDGAYTMRLWEKREGPDGQRFVLVEEPHIPTRRGEPLTFIPFAMDPAIDPPPLLDVVDVNLAHYRTNADYKHSLHLSALATPWVTGWDNTEAELKVGASTAWVIPEPTARIGYLEVSGNGLQAMLEDMKAAEAQMAVLVARLLEPQKRAVEAAETHEIRQTSELSILEAYATAASHVMTKALRWHAWWIGATQDLKDETITFLLNTDFLPTTIDAPKLTALVTAHKQGALTKDDLYYNFMQGNLLTPGVTLEEWIAQLTAEAEQQAADQLAHAQAHAQALAQTQSPPGANGAAARREGAAPDV